MQMQTVPVDVLPARTRDPQVVHYGHACNGTTTHVLCGQHPGEWTASTRPVTCATCLRRYAALHVID